MKVVIVGGVAGGAAAAARIRRLDEHAEIIIFERTGFVSYASCGFPYYVGGVVADKEELIVRTPQTFKELSNIDVRILSEVVAIDTKGKTVSVHNLATGERYSESYDKLLLSPGAKPFRPEIPGIDKARVFFLRTVEDAVAVRSFVETGKPKSAVLVGGGYIGVEMAENLSGLGIKVSIVQRPKQLMNTFDSDIASFVHDRLRKAGIDLRLGAEVTGFQDGPQGGIKVLLKDEPPISTDMVLMAIGVRPDTYLAKDAGLALGIKDSIAVNDRMETSAPDIYAVGDAVQIKHAVSGQDALISLAGPANKQGRIAADNICGGDSRYKGSLGSSVIKVFDMTAASTGLSEKAAAAAGIDCDSVRLTPTSYASYYPGSRKMMLKVVYEKETFRLLGAQAVGHKGVEKRIDVITTAISCGMRADELADLDLAYAPPYSSVRDPVNLAGSMIENIKKAD